MKKKFKITILILSIIIFSLFVRYILNAYSNKEYLKSNYHNGIVSVLYMFNIQEPYINYYNNGNILYRQENYKEAKNKYETALKRSPPKKKVCDIRTNLSLSMIKLINKDNDSSIVLKELKEAREVLYKNDCAHENDDDGYSKNAENLEQEIKDLEEAFQTEEPKGKDDDENNDDPDDEENKNIEDELKDIEKRSRAQREDNNDFDSNFGNYNLYDGKSW